MKFACELVVSEVLPTARRELARELISAYGLTQISVANMFGVTGAAISQYMKGVRGVNEWIYTCDHSEAFMEVVRRSAKLLYEDKSDLVIELCKICDFAKSTGMLDEMNRAMGMEEPYSRCHECPNSNYDGPGKDFVFKV